MKNIFSVILAVLMLLNAGAEVVPTEDNIDEFLSSDCRSVASFIDENFELFVDEFQKTDATLADWNPSCVENISDIEIVTLDGEADGLLLDFEDKYGYAVLADDYIFCDFVTEGASPFEGVECDGYMYSELGGYFYLSDGEYSSVNPENEMYSEDILCSSSDHYDGQDDNATGCGKIKDTDAYIKAKYGTGFSVKRSNSLAMYGYDQYALSCYHENLKSGGTASEANCWVVSAYNVLQYYADNKYSSMPASSTERTYDPKTSESRIYKKYFDKDGNNISGKIKQDSGTEVYKYVLADSPIKFNELWCKTREYVNDEYGKINNGIVWDTARIIRDVAYEYDVDIDTSVYVGWKLVMGSVMDDIDAGTPFIWSTGTGSYGSHTMAGCGYKLYTKTTSWWRFTNTKTVLLYELKDGHNGDNSRYYDVSAFNGLAALIFLYEE